eukprot:1309929-Rhodomonas_salina.1
MIAELRQKQAEARRLKAAQEAGAQGDTGAGAGARSRGGGGGEEEGGQAQEQGRVEQDGRPSKRPRSASDSAHGPGPAEALSRSNPARRRLSGDTDMGHEGRVLPAVPEPWVAVWSEVAGRPFFFNSETQ